MKYFNRSVFRYSPATQLWRGRLHVMGGSKENRHTPGLEHWSIAVKDGKALEKAWSTEIPIPRGGPHRFVGFPHVIYLSLVSSVEDLNFYVIQVPWEYNFKFRIAIPDHENQFSNRACFVFNDRLFVVGGQEGDFMAKPGSPIFKCSRRHEVYKMMIVFQLLLHLNWL